MEAEAAQGKHLERLHVVGLDQGDEAANADRRGSRDKLIEDLRTETVTLKVIGDDEGDLGSVALAQAVVAAESDDLFALRSRASGDQRALLEPVAVDHSLEQRGVDRGGAVEALRVALGREVAKELDDLVDLFR